MKFRLILPLVYGGFSALMIFWGLRSEYGLIDQLGYVFIPALPWAWLANRLMPELSDNNYLIAVLFAGLFINTYISLCVGAFLDRFIARRQASNPK